MSRVQKKGRRVVAATAALVGALVAAGCNPFSDAGAARSMTVAPDGSGSVFVRRAGEEIEVTGRFSLAASDVVRTTTPGARILLESDRTAWLADDSSVRITGGGSLEVLGGSVLAESRRHLTVSIDDVTATTSGGMMRVDRFSASAAVAGYAGEVAVAAPGQETVAIDPLFDASVTAGQVLDPRPYQVDLDDRWDRLHLGDVVELDEQLERYADAISGQLGGTSLSTSFFRNLEGRDAGQDMVRYMDSRAFSAPDLLIGFSIADLDETTSKERALSRAFGLRRAGGQWGVVATIMGVRSGPLVAGLENLIFAAGAMASVPGAGSDVGAGSTAEGGGSPGRPARGSGGSSGGDGAGGGNGGSAPGAEEPPGGSGDTGGGGDDASPPPDDECENLIDCVVGILQLDTGPLP